MKKLSLILVAVLLLSLFAACADTGSSAGTTAPGTDAPATDAPKTDAPGTDAPVTDTPSTDAPASTAPATEAPETQPANVFRFTRENFPRLDGSTACIPLGEAICSVLLGESREQVQDLVKFNRTTQSFRNLMEGSCDLLISGEPNAAVYDEMKEQGFEADIATFARDGLVFLVNENNPVDNLSTEQLRGIYSGKITNWKEVGGEDAPIIPIQRNEGAGSQALMKKLVMKDLPLMDAPAEYVPGSMGELMTVVKSYDASANAIGYSVYYYAHDMEMAKGLKLLKVDGVEPTRDTIRDQSYPHLNAYYCVIAHSVPENSPIRILYNWIMSEDGQRLIAREGYVSAMDVG
jgi:ABC-type phosphate transport system substrate-binding protein